MRLWIHLMVTGHYPSRVPPFGYPRINAYLRLPVAFRSLSRPSSAISALASTLRSFTLDLASAPFPFLRLLRWEFRLICGRSSVPRSSDFPSPLLKESGHQDRRTFLIRFECFPVQFSRCDVEWTPTRLLRCPCEPSKRYSEEIQSEYYYRSYGLSTCRSPCFVLRPRVSGAYLISTLHSQLFTLAGSTLGFERRASASLVSP